MIETAKNAHEHMIAFIDTYQKKLFPLPFLLSTISSEDFFTPICNSSFFSEEQKQKLAEMKMYFVGELLFNDFRKNPLFQNVKALQQSFGIGAAELNRYTKLKHAIERMPIGSVLVYSEIESLFDQTTIRADTCFGEKKYKVFCAENSFFTEYSYVCTLLWCKKNYKGILQ